MTAQSTRLSDIVTRIRDEFNTRKPRLMLAGGAIYQRLKKSSATDYALAWGDEFATIPCFFFGGGVAIAAGAQLDVAIDFDCDVQSWIGLGDQAGSISVSVWLDTYANYPPVVADKISASTPLTITAGIKGTGSPTGWTTFLPAGSTVRFNVDSAATIQRFYGGLKVKKR